MADDIKLVVGVDYSDLTGLVKTSEQTKRVLSSAAKDFARTGNQKQYMHSINKIVQSQKQLDASSRMNRSQLMQLGAEMQREAKFTDELSRATHRLSGAMGASRNKMNGSNMAVQQLGYQVGDFAVQVQGGTSAFVAFSQQGAQLAGMLPMVAGPLGLSMKMAVGLSAAFGILIPIGSAVARMFFEMKDSAKEAAEEADTLNSKLESLSDTLEDYANTLAALQSGVSLDELFASRGVEDATDALDEATEALDRLNASSRTGSTGQIVFQGLLNLLPGNLSIAEKEEVAVQAVVEARTRLQLLLEKEADTRASNFAESSVAMKQELELLQAQARYGEDSAQAKNAGLDQELRNRLAAIDAQVVSGELDEAAAASLKLQAERAAELTAQIEAAADAEERRLAAIQVFYAYQTQIANQQQQRQAGVDAISTAVESQILSLRSQTRIYGEIVRHGRDSAEVRAVEASQAREVYRLAQMQNGILGNNLKLVMAEYDVMAATAKTAERVEAARRDRDFAKETLVELQNQAALQELINEHGKDSAEVAEERLRVERETFEAMVDELNIADSLKEELMAAHDAAAALGLVDVGAGIRSAETSAENLARSLGIALSSAIALTTLTPMMSDEDIAMGQTTAPVSQGSIQDALSRYQDIIAPKSGGGSDPFDQDAYLESLQEEANFKRSLVGLGEAETTELERRREIVQRMTEDGQTLNAADEERIKNILATEAATRRAIAAEEQRQATFDMVSGHIEDAFMAMVDGSKSVEDAFKGMLRNILIEVYKQAVAKPIVGGIMSFLGFKDGGAFSGGNVIPFANGGVVSSATMFPMAGKQTGVMGEAGPEAIMPLKRGANGKLGVQVQGGGGENVVINQNFNFQANGDDSVKRIIAQAAPQIANMTKKSMMDDRRRGGQMKSTFG